MESSILVNRDLREVKLEGEELNEGGDFPTSVKIEEKSSPNDGTSEEAYEEEEYTEFFGVSKEVSQRLPPPCSCQEEIESLKCTVKQLTLEMQKQSEAMKKQNEVITGIKSCIRNVAVSMLTCCEDKEELGNDLGGRNEFGELSKGVETSGPIAWNPEPPLKTSEVLSGTINEAFQDEERSNPISIVKCTGGGDAKTIPMPSVSSFSPSDPKTRSNEVGSLSFCSWAGQNTEEEETAAMTDVIFQDNKDSSYVPDESEKDAEEEMEDENNYNGASSSNTKSVKTSAGFPCWECSKVFKLKNYLHKHIRRIHSKRSGTPNVKCQLCLKVFNGNRHLQRHVQSAHEGVRYKCAYCPGKFTSLQNVQRHENSVHRDNGLPKRKCKICGIHLVNSKSLHIHMSLVHKEMEFARERMQQFLEKRKPTKAMRRRIIFQCQLCPISFPERAELHSHQRRVHGIDTIIEAEVEK